jgi:hypothetical protein
MSSRVQRVIAFTAVVFCSLLALPGEARAWGDEGHEIVALIADHFLEPAVKVKIDAMLAADTDSLTAHDIASAATWADKYRDSDRNSTKERYNQTHNWHFVDIEISQPDIDAACFGHPPIPPGTPAIQGPQGDCVVDKINQFSAELADPNTSAEERLDALKFVLHFVGDLHQPLHSSDNHDAGGNKVRVSSEGFKAGNLHHFWDTEFVRQIGSDPQQVADGLIAKIGVADAKSWAKGSPTDWAQEAFGLAKDHAYGKLPEPNARDSYRLDAGYVSDATGVVASQLSKAGVRLASLLNKALAAN